MVIGVSPAYSMSPSPNPGTYLIHVTSSSTTYLNDKGQDQGEGVGGILYVGAINCNLQGE